MRRPRVKPEHAPYRVGGERIRIGGMSYGLAAEIEDPTGALWTLLGSLDGTRSVDGAVAATAARHPGTPPALLEQAVADLVAAGHVEDAAGPEPAGLTARDKARHDRGRRWFRWVDLVPRASSWDAQARLARSRVTVVGLGGSGAGAAAALAASGVGRLHCVDPDAVELSNLNRQVLYSEDDIGRPKVDAALERLRAPQHRHRGDRGAPAGDRPGAAGRAGPGL